jgi:aspartate oxidase
MKESTCQSIDDDVVIIGGKIAVLTLTVTLQNSNLSVAIAKATLLEVAAATPLMPFLSSGGKVLII